ncbi:hypothetical protein SEMRO_1867_G302551.1 [Seminavis robusta]|uniref:Uncharacterized protein n=1 Tax=Seminavis robusta TaxID=568900 RepID=A0A9N8EVB1_9STRA|nr:hypothetical protein SEMRO_1867_G302551.1 [Seminavis robusta]|eukprot:Sro1867_g302551.1  (207) ;mRNA; f:4298-4918
MVANIFPVGAVVFRKHCRSPQEASFKTTTNAQKGGYHWFHLCSPRMMQQFGIGISTWGLLATPTKAKRHEMLYDYIDGQVFWRFFSWRKSGFQRFHFVFRWICSCRSSLSAASTQSAGTVESNLAEDWVVLHERLEHTSSCTSQASTGWLHVRCFQLFWNRIESNRSMHRGTVVEWATPKDSPTAGSTPTKLGTLLLLSGTHWIRP